MTSPWGVPYGAGAGWLQAGQLLLQAAPSIIEAGGSVATSRQASRAATIQAGESSRQQLAYQVALQRQQLAYQAAAESRKMQALTAGIVVFGIVALLAIIAKRR